MCKTIWNQSLTTLWESATAQVVVQVWRLSKFGKDRANNRKQLTLSGGGGWGLSWADPVMWEVRATKAAWCNVRTTEDETGFLLTGCFQKPENTDLKYVWESNPENINKVSSKKLIHHQWSTNSIHGGEGRKGWLMRVLCAVRLAYWWTGYSGQMQQNSRNDNKLFTPRLLFFHHSSFPQRSFYYWD